MFWGDLRPPGVLHGDSLQVGGTACVTCHSAPVSQDMDQDLAMVLFVGPRTEPGPVRPLAFQRRKVSTPDPADGASKSRKEVEKRCFIGVCFFLQRVILLGVLNSRIKMCPPFLSLFVLFFSRLLHPISHPQSSAAWGETC